MKSAAVEREAGDQHAERTLLQEGITRFPTFAKLYLMLGQLEERAGLGGCVPLEGWVRADLPPAHTGQQAVRQTC